MEHPPAIDDLRRLRPEFADLEFVAQGGFKAVYKASLNGRMEAVKVVYVPPEAEEDSGREEILARVRREIEALRLCPTPSMVRIGSIPLQLIRIGGGDYLLYSEELLPGESLRQRIKAGHRPVLAELRGLFKSMMEALQALHQISHIHRDIKPDNVMATGLEERPFVLLDLGIAFKVRGTELTARHGGPPGTLVYMAPELFQPNYKDVLDIRSDIYSAGVTLFEYASGIHPLARRGEPDYTTVYRILNQPPLKLLSLRPDLPEDLAFLIERCMKRLPAFRFANPRMVLKALEAFE
jgi:serine/threonine protein kinase